MARLPQDLEEKRLKLLGLARVRSFDSYVRYGRVPEAYSCAASLAVAAGKAVDPHSVPSVLALGNGRSTTHYVWRTAGDERVRGAHAALAEHVFSWSNGPSGGHPGAERNCRCWAEPYYGDPAVSDASLQMYRTSRADTTGRELWTHIETLRRPDGSLAQSSILGRDGTSFRSSFAGTHVTHVATLTSGDSVRLDTDNGTQSIYLGDQSRPLLQSAWTTGGPVVVRDRQLVAFQVPRGPLEPGFDPLALYGDGAGGGGGAGPAAILALSILALYDMQRSAPDSMGVGASDVSVLAFKAWKSGDQVGATPIRLDALTAEQVQQSCKRLPQVQAFTDLAASELANQRAILGPAVWGTAVHSHVKRSVEALQTISPDARINLLAELSLHPDLTAGAPAHYGRDGSTRLDVFERVDPMLVCVYDVKTGRKGLTAARIAQIAAGVESFSPGAVFYILQVEPRLFERP